MDLPRPFIILQTSQLLSVNGTIYLGTQNCLDKAAEKHFYEKLVTSFFPIVMPNLKIICKTK
jgi:hypothetical protein